jgi:hypothetical protein
MILDLFREEIEFSSVLSSDENYRSTGQRKNIILAYWNA